MQAQIIRAQVYFYRLSGQMVLSMSILALPGHIEMYAIVDNFNISTWKSLIIYVPMQDTWRLCVWFFFVASYSHVWHDTLGATDFHNDWLNFVHYVSPNATVFSISILQ